MKEAKRQGYYQKPQIVGDTLCFLAEGDIWRSDLPKTLKTKAPQHAWRLTAGLGSVTSLALSPGAQTIGFVSTQEGQTALYVMPAEGGDAKRVTYLAGLQEVLMFEGEDQVIVRSHHASPFPAMSRLYRLHLQTGSIEELNVGPARFISFGDQKTFLGRHGYGYISWKRYRGGTAGEIWAKDGSTFKRLFEDLKSNLLNPLFVKGRLYFLSDHEGMGALYSATPSGQQLKRHTDFQDFYVRNLATDGTRLTYQKGGDLWLFDPVSQKSTCLLIEIKSVGPLKARYFAPADASLSAYALSQEGDQLCLTTRGRLFAGQSFRGPMMQLGKRHGVRYRLGTWIDNQRVLGVCDEGFHEKLEVFDTAKNTSKAFQKDWGRLIKIAVAPSGDFAVAENHKHELLHITLKTGAVQKIDHSRFGMYRGFDISPDSRYVAYSFALSHDIYGLKIWDAKTKKTHCVTEPVLGDTDPTFDPKGRYLYFLSARHFRDGPLKVKPYLITLAADTPSPFVAQSDQADDKGDDKADDTADEKAKKTKKPKVPPCVIDFEGICARALAFPVPSAFIRGLCAAQDRVFLLTKAEAKSPIEVNEDGAAGAKGYNVSMYDLVQLKQDLLMGDVISMQLSPKKDWMAFVSSQKRVRVLRTGEKGDDEDTSYRKGGWFDFERIALEIDPHQEWCFMFFEAWRLQKDLFWDEKMKKLDWDGVKKRYAALLDRIHTPSELMDLIGEMQGELGASHAYTWGFDQGEGPDYSNGQLGATFKPAPSGNGVVIKAFDAPEVCDNSYRSPLLAPGLNLRVGDHILAVDGQAITPQETIDALLCHKADKDVALSIKRLKPLKAKKASAKAAKDKAGEKTALETLWVQPKRNLEDLYYADFVRKNRAYVHQKTKGDVGYIHIPDMVAAGYQAFFKSYLHEFERKALILDVRFNRGGNVSSELLSQLMRKRLGYDQSRHEGQMPYMANAPQGPMVALCNEYTGSDGDMFSHAFQGLKLGPLIGKRTWGGVIGIFPKYDLLDGSWTSQPEYAIWFHDVGWGLENEGATPDIVVEISPEDAVKGQDPQLDRGIEEALLEIKRKKTA